MKSLSRVRLFATPWTIPYQAPKSMGFSRQEYWSGLPFPSPGDLPDPGIELGSPALGAQSLSHWTKREVPVSVLYCVHLCMKCSLGISNFLEEISSLSHSIVFLYFFALITEEGFLISSCYSLELCIQMGISFLLSFAFHFSSFLSYLKGLFRQTFCLLAVLFLEDGFDHRLVYSAMNLRP